MLAHTLFPLEANRWCKKKNLCSPPITDLCAASCSTLWHISAEAVEERRPRHGRPQTWQHLTINLTLTFPSTSVWHTNTTLADVCRAWPFIHRDEFLCTSVLLVAEWAHEAEFVSHKAVIGSQKRHYGLLHFDISNCKCTLSTCIVLKAGVCVCLHFYLVATASLQSGGPSLCPVGAWRPLSGPGCDGWAEEDPGIQASACSSSVLSSVEETERKKPHQPGRGF